MPTPRGGLDSIGPTGPPTRVPELLARTPAIARASSLIGVDILDPDCQRVGRLDDLLARPDGRLVAIVAREDGRLVGLPLDEMIARAKPDRPGSERATIKSFKLTREGRRLDAAPAVEDKSKLDEAWLAKLDAGTPQVRGQTGRSLPPPEPEPAPPKPAEPASDAAPPAAESAPEAAAETPPVASEPASETVPSPAATTAPLPTVSTLLAQPALDPAGQPVGTLVDFVVGVQESRVAYLLVMQHEGPEGPDTLHAVPLDALVASSADAGVRLSLDAASLAASPRIEELTRLPVDPLASAAPGGSPLAAPHPRVPAPTPR
jgi:sporulation protein YlmC with PRC-barrel domain